MLLPHMHSLPHYHEHPPPEWYIVTTDTSQSPKVHSLHYWWCTFCGFGQIYKGVYPELQYQKEYFYCPKNPLFSAHLSPSPNPWKPLIFFFTFFIILSFLGCHILGIIYHVAFSDWLLLLSNMHLSFLHVFSIG